MGKRECNIHPNKMKSFKSWKKGFPSLLTWIPTLRIGILLGVIDVQNKFEKSYMNWMNFKWLKKSKKKVVKKIWDCISKTLFFLDSHEGL
jgi:hypothetical protein